MLWAEALLELDRSNFAKAVRNTATLPRRPHREYSEYPCEYPAGPTVSTQSTPVSTPQAPL